MAVFVLIIVVLIIIAVALTALSGRFRRFDAVLQPDDSIVRLESRGNRVKMIPKDEQTTDSAVRRANAYDGSDDLLDPNNPGHAQWLDERQRKPGGGSTPSNETS